MTTSTNPAPPDRDAFADRRVYPRVPVALPAFLQADGQRHAVQLCDVSAGGAKLHCSASLAVGSPIMLDCGTLSRPAVIRWRNGDLFGLMFDSELDERVVSALFERSRVLEELMRARD